MLKPATSAGSLTFLFFKTWHRFVSCMQSVCLYRGLKDFPFCSKFCKELTQFVVQIVTWSAWTQVLHSFWGTDLVKSLVSTRFPTTSHQYSSQPSPGTQRTSSRGQPLLQMSGTCLSRVPAGTQAPCTAQGGSLSYTMNSRSAATFPRYLSSVFPKKLLWSMQNLS